MILYEKNYGTGTLTLNRAEKRNALHPTMISELKSKLSEIERDDDVKVVIITGAGNSFCAGADLSYLSELGKNTAVENEKDSEQLAEMFLAIYNFSKPTIAAVNGAAIAGGCGLASVCDFIIADINHAKFGYSEVKIGFIPAIVSIFLINRIGFGRANRLMLSAEIIDAKKAYEFGLIDYLADDVLKEAKNLAEELKKNSSESMNLTKKMLRSINNLNPGEAVDYCVRLNTISRSTGDFRRGLEKFLKDKKG